ncbi:hypothetical protein M427DRAFT_31120 [Gonapodya prolifera JEL478]|uniref:Uncharacterized protein n=1 Tax=Gonapodya prolifera (strain JEL478) TaxID=1344416 RepID=A0A139AIX7_GONPJ|nr:hypothetical protein M427DRAFT_31120 [Gonapodya prolifera JEL478]|eukprot:KXS16737.1 hypothetical protein M427DRAFT_31120 [Gonapodya prolifera JEL478]
MSMDLKDRRPSYPYHKFGPSVKSLNTFLELLEPWFIFHGNLEYIDGMEIEPVKASGEREEDFKQRKKEWTLQNSKAFLMLQTSLSDEAQNMIQHLLKGNRNAAHLFAAIRANFQLKAADLITLERQLMDRKMKPRAPVANWHTDIIKIGGKWKSTRGESFQG